MVLDIPRDRNSEFEPRLIPKGKRMSDQLEDAILGMYSRAMTVSDIADQVKDVYETDVSEGTISNVTYRLNEHIALWLKRPLDPVYLTLWMDGIILRIKSNRKHIGIGIKRDG